MLRPVTVAVVAALAAIWLVGAGTSAGGPAPQQVSVVMGDFWFKPSSIAVNAGQIKIALKNNGVVGHTYVIEKVKGATLDLIDPGKAGTLTVTLRSGKYLAFCDVPGHREAGMEMTVTVK